MVKGFEHTWVQEPGETSDSHYETALTGEMGPDGKIIIALSLCKIEIKRPHVKQYYIYIYIKKQYLSFTYEIMY